MSAAGLLVEKGLILHRAGRLRDALETYHAALEADPGNADAHHLTGLAEMSRGNLDIALTHVQTAARIDPSQPDFRNSLGQIWQALGRVDDALDAYRQALDLDEGHIEARNNLALLLKATGHPEEALEELRHALALAPTRAQLHLNLGSTLITLRRAKEAEGAFREAVRLTPDNAAAWTSLATASYSQGHLDDARQCLDTAIALAPDMADAHTLLGLVLQDAGQFAAAVAAHGRALEIAPNQPGVHVNLGNAHRASGRLDDAIAAYRRAIEIDPGTVSAWTNLGVCLRDRGEFAAAEDALEKALDIQPKHANAHMQLLLLKLTDGAHSVDEIFAEHKVWEARHAKRIYALGAPRHNNDPDPNRKLRIGYLSSDLRNHPIAINVEPLLNGHDREKFAVFVYSNVLHEDETSRRIKEMVDNWTRIVGIDDARAAEMIRNDGIDILVSLGGHMDQGRLLICAYKPAPIVVSFHDVTTSGLKTVDYLFSDRHLTPPGHPEKFTERLFRLPSFYVFKPLQDAPEPMEPPSVRDEQPITFGSFNNPAKITDAMIRLWATILREVDGSRLFLKYRRAFENPGTRRRFIDAFARAGIPAERILAAGMDDGIAGHLAAYNQIDIALDTAPFNGSTTTRDALWMGVPVVTLAGDVMLARASAETLHLVGLDDFIATTPRDYVAKAVALAADPQTLRTLRHTLRDRMRASRLLAHGNHAYFVERAYRAMWRKWCAERE